MVRIPVTSKPKTSNTPHDPLKSPEQHTANTHHLHAATDAPDRPRSVDGEEDTVGPQDVPDPTVSTDGEGEGTGTTTGPEVDAPTTDPTVPPATQPVDRAEGMFDVLGNVAPEMEGPAGADVTGGDVTNPQDADQAVQDNVNTRVEEQEMFRRQQTGEVGTQTDHLKPSPGNPEQGLPENPTGSESSSGGASPGASPQIDETGEGGGETPGGASGESGSEGAADGGAASNAVSALEAELAETKERLLLLAADFENYRRQAARREVEVRERVTKSVLEDLLPVLDNFERALQAARHAKDMESLRVGIEYIYQQLSGALRSHGVEPIDAHGKPFDPLHHDALEEVHSEEHPEGTVVEEAQRGYSFKGQVLRPSRVRVAGSKKKQTQSS
ncbi:MAG: nucleotide exchange factor GrpE [Armatimonadota bacterium]|nr:nucleotide exchange factor GrpE [Armatimonadota bacterium]